MTPENTPNNDLDFTQNIPTIKPMDVLAQELMSAEKVKDFLLNQEATPQNEASIEMATRKIERLRSEINHRKNMEGETPTNHVDEPPQKGKFEDTHIYPNNPVQ